jgi:hypothetical protein
LVVFLGTDVSLDYKENLELRQYPTEDVGAWRRKKDWAGGGYGGNII